MSPALHNKARGLVEWAELPKESTWGNEINFESLTQNARMSWCAALSNKVINKHISDKRLDVSWLKLSDTDKLFEEDDDAGNEEYGDDACI
jgi:hypothetical protein